MEPKETESTSGVRARERRHLGLLREQFDAIARGDIERVLASAVEDVELDIFAPPEFKWIVRARGLDELRSALAENFSAVTDQHPEIVNVFAQGNTIVLFGRETGRIRGANEPYDVEFVEKFTFRDDRLASIRIIIAKRNV